MRTGVEEDQYLTLLELSDGLPYVAATVLTAIEPEDALVVAAATRMRNGEGGRLLVRRADGFRAPHVSPPVSATVLGRSRRVRLTRSIGGVIERRPDENKVDADAVARRAIRALLTRAPRVTYGVRRRHRAAG